MCSKDYHHGSEMIFLCKYRISTSFLSTPRMFHQQHLLNTFHVPGAKRFIWIQSSQLSELGAIIISVLQMQKMRHRERDNLLNITQLITHTAGIWTQAVNSSILGTRGETPTTNGFYKPVYPPQHEDSAGMGFCLKSVLINFHLRRV